MIYTKDSQQDGHTLTIKQAQENTNGIYYIE